MTMTQDKYLIWHAYWQVKYWTEKDPNPSEKATELLTRVERNWPELTVSPPLTPYRTDGWKE